MTSIGIRGCEVALRSTGDREWIYVIGLEPGESVEIQADREERVINDMQTGRRPAGAGADIGTVEVSRERTVVSVAREKGIVENRVVSARELRNIIDSTSRRPHARFRVHQNSAETVFFVSPRTDNGRQADDE
jgi:flagellar basal body P-ring protein FlgI